MGSDSCIMSAVSREWCFICVLWESVRDLCVLVDASVFLLSAG